MQAVSTLKVIWVTFKGPNKDALDGSGFYYFLRENYDPMNCIGRKKWNAFSVEVDEGTYNPSFHVNELELTQLKKICQSFGWLFQTKTKRAVNVECPSRALNPWMTYNTLIDGKFIYVFPAFDFQGLLRNPHKH